MTSQRCHHRNKVYTWYSELNFLQIVYFGFLLFGELME